MTASPAGRQIGLHREMPHPGVGLGYRHNRPGLQGVGVGFEDGEEPAEGERCQPRNLGKVR